ncbi:MAG: lytic murein transglycosylase B [Paraglaciecola sp.]|nr:lytic murein transglycosylase B [Paraglaciecola sp.]NCT48158.1 lytic murein transglycosylase B [Paraglaciecola sp.]
MWLFAAGIAPALGQSSLPKEQQTFVDEMVNKHHFTEQSIISLLQSADKNDDILEAIAKPWEAKPWYQYYPIFLTQKRLANGLAFWQQYAEALARAEQQTGVPAQIIVAILGVESFYGAYTGKYSTLDALYTLGFYYPKRSQFFRSEFAQFLLLCREENLDPGSILGSYAGALGWGQFIPSSYRHYAVDFDGDGQRNLFQSPIDAIGSVANYFKQHRWQTGGSVARQAVVSGTKYQQFLTNDLKAKYSWAELQSAGVNILTDNAGANTSVADDNRFALLSFAQVDHQEFWLTEHNFYVISRYNHSPLYAMAVFQFSLQLKSAWQTLNNESANNE